MILYDYSDVDEYGFKRPEDFDYENYEQFMSKYLTILTQRRIKWEKYLKTNPKLYKNKTNKIKRYIRNGIPGMCLLI